MEVLEILVWLVKLAEPMMPKAALQGMVDNQDFLTDSGTTISWLISPFLRNKAMIWHSQFYITDNIWTAWWTVGRREWKYLATLLSKGHFILLF